MVILPLVASLALIIASNRWEQKISAFAQPLSRLVWPIQYTVDLPILLIEKSQKFFTERSSLLAENKKLHQQQMFLQAQVQKYRALQAENQELRELLQSADGEKETFSEGRLLHADSDPFGQHILLNKGKQHGIEKGQPVIDAKGLVGVVLEVNEYTSDVLLLTDSGFSVPVQCVRSGERAIATGSGTGRELRLHYVPRTADFMEGDQLVTSGIGGGFPVGYPVGMISSIQHDSSSRFSVIAVDPNAKLGQLRHVLFVKNNQPITATTTTTTMAAVEPSKEGS